MKKYPFYKQADGMDCGPTCIRMVAKYHGRNYTIQRLREISGITRTGVSLLGISEAAEKVGFRTNGVRISLDVLLQLEMPCILHWTQNHFVVLYEVPDKIAQKGKNFIIGDPMKGIISYTEAEFTKRWISTKTDGRSEGIVLSMSTSPEFYDLGGDPEKKLDLSHMLVYLKQYRSLIFQIFLSLFIGSMLQLILPFLAQSLVDIGINTRNINFVYVIVGAQTALLIGRMSVDFIRSWILLHISARVNMSILTDFLIKLMKLPVSYFETKLTGDIMQRMSDQGRIQSFLTGTSLGTVFSVVNLLMFGGLLLFYSWKIFLVFSIGSILYSFWVVFFLEKRRELDFKRFDISSESQTSLLQLIHGMQEIKMNNCERTKRWEWERVQASLFKFSLKGLALGQYQHAGAFFINEGKNIAITFMTIKGVIDGNLTFGGLLAVQYIIGQLNGPIEQLLGFVQQLQDAKMSLERMSEVHELEDEEPVDRTFIHELPDDKSINFNNVSFSYPGAGSEPVLENVDLYIPEGKTTAIVGMSGSGKTTLLKLLLRFYKLKDGEIKIGATNLDQISPSFWRKNCGIVMQEGYIFSDTIARNIAVIDEHPDNEKVLHAVKMSNIGDFIKELPLGLNTKIGAAGNGISQGQRQRLLIARAVYKDPEYIFFDEATNSLDANNERIIMDNLNTLFKGRTVIVVAHRLSTVKNADNIVVLEKGKIIEQGDHEALIEKKGKYFELVKNQLELGL